MPEAEFTVKHRYKVGQRVRITVPVRTAFTHESRQGAVFPISSLYTECWPWQYGEYYEVGTCDDKGGAFGWILCPCQFEPVDD